MKTRKPSLWMMLAATTVVSVLNACGSSPSSSSSASPTAVNIRGVTLTLWREDYDQAGIDAVNAAFEQQTGVKIVVTKVMPPGDNSILPKWSTGSKPDILYLEGFDSTMAKLDASQDLLPLGNLPFVKNIQPSLKQFGVLNGVRYWAPLTAPSVNGLLYNKEVMQTLGLALPTNLQSLLSFCTAASAKGITPIALGEKDTFMAWAMLDAMQSNFLIANPNFGQELLQRKASFTDPGYVQVIQSILDLKNAGCYGPNAQALDYNDAMTMIMSNKAAIENCGNFCVPDLLGAFPPAEVNAKIGFLPISYSSPAEWVYGGDDWGMYLINSGDATKEAAAKAYLNFALGAGYDIYLNATHEESRYPTAYPVPDASAVAVPIQEAQAALAKYPAAPALEPLIECGYGVPGDLFTELSQLYVGQLTAMQVAQDMEASLKQSCQDLGVPGF